MVKAVRTDMAERGMADGDWELGNGTSSLFLDGRKPNARCRYGDTAIVCLLTADH